MDSEGLCPFCSELKAIARHWIRGAGSSTEHDHALREIRPLLQDLDLYARVSNKNETRRTPEGVPVAMWVQPVSKGMGKGMGKASSARGSHPSRSPHSGSSARGSGEPPDDSAPRPRLVPPSFVVSSPTSTAAGENRQCRGLAQCTVGVSRCTCCWPEQDRLLFERAG